MTEGAWIDAGLLSPVRVGAAIETAVSDRAWLQAMLDAEAALARAQARLGTTPADAATVISHAARADRFDIRALAVAGREAANPVVGLVRELTRIVAADDPAAADHVHRGATSQDILDTAAMLVTARAARLVRADLCGAADALVPLAAAHRDTLMVGRTLTQHAVPTTFGLKAAGWLLLVQQAVERLDAVLDALPVSLGGAAGTLAGYLEHARAADVDLDSYPERLLDAFASETGLRRPVLPWHALRTPIADVAAALGFTAAALGKIAVDVLSLTRTEVAEVTEAPVAGRGSSSAMPHKRNPVLATLVRSAAMQVPAMTTALTQCLVTEDERSAGVWQAEWLMLRECLRVTGGAAHTAAELIAGLEVSPERMRRNLELTGSQVVSERVVAVLARHLGKATARSLLRRATATCGETGRPLHEVLAEAPELVHQSALTGAALAELCDPAAYTGAAGALVDGTLEGAPGGRPGRHNSR